MVVYKCGVREINGYKVPDAPEHAYKWRVNEIKTEYTEEGNINEYFVVRSEMEDTEFEKIKDSVEVLRVVKV